MLMNTPQGSLLFSVARQELLAHLAAREAHHETRMAHWANEADRHERELEDQLQRGETVTDRVHIKSSSNYANAGNARDQARAKVQEHARRAAFFGFAKRHLPEGEAALLVDSELTALELIPSSRF